MGSMIRRDLHTAEQTRFDVVIAGAGVYGITLALEAARRGLRPAVIDRGDFGGATSANSLRILHGGLRYLQKADLPRFRESVAERRWFCQHFPDLVQPLACLMPLYGRGLKRPGIFRAALAINDQLSRHRNRGVARAVHLPGGGVLGRDETLERFPAADPAGLKGAGLWYDAVMPASQRVLMEMLHWACSLGAVALNYVEATELLTQRGRAAGIRAVDRLAGRQLDIRGRVVINAAGPWCRQVARALDRDHEPLFRPSLAFNLLIDREPPSDAALAVQPPGPAARVYFLQPWRGRIFVGTSHAPWADEPDAPEPRATQVAQMLADLSEAVPGWSLSPDDVLQTCPGLLPAAAPGTEELAVREVIHDHQARGGPAGLYSVSGVKFTTARRVAEKTLRRAWSAAGGLPPYQPGSDRPVEPQSIDPIDPAALFSQPRRTLAPLLRRLVQEEAVQSADDLLRRRTDWAAHPAYDATEVARRLDELIDLPAPSAA